MIPFQIMHSTPSKPTLTPLKTMVYAVFVDGLEVGYWNKDTTEFESAVLEVQDSKYSDKHSVSKFLSNAFKVPIDAIRFEAIAPF